MAAVSTTLLVFGGLAIGSTAYSMTQANEAENRQYEASQEQKKIQREQQAQNAGQQAAERRRLVREERVKRARVIASSNAAGTSGSSGEAGAIGSLSTQLNTNIGSSLSQVKSANDISIFAQASSDFMSQANQLNFNAKLWGEIADLSGKAGKAAM
jgi:hypothetical protein